MVDDTISEFSSSSMYVVALNVGFIIFILFEFSQDSFRLHNFFTPKSK